MKMNEQIKTDNQNKGRFLKKLLTKKVIVILVILMVSGLIAIGLKRSLFSEQKTTYLGFENISELATQSAYCTEVNVTDSPRELFGLKIPFTQSKYIYSYDFVIKAGLDFSDIDWSITETTIQVKLPEVKILSNEVKPDSFQVYHESESIFNQITLDENNAALKELQVRAESDAIENGLLQNARSNAETVLTGFFSSAYDLNEYTIEFTDK